MVTLPRGADRRPRGLPSAPPARCGSRPSTRWAPRAWTPIRARGVTGPTARSTAPRRLYVADGSLLPSSIGVNPMMTIVAIAARVGRGLAERAA